MLKMLRKCSRNILEEQSYIFITRDGNKENNLADKVADKLFFYQTNEKITGQAFSWSSTASCFIFEQPFTKALSFSLPRFVWMFWPQQISQYIKLFCCCHISTRVCLLSILLWTPNPWFFLMFLGRRWLSWTCACWLLWLFCLWLWCMGLFATHIFYFCIFILTFIFLFLAALFSSSFFLFKNCLISILLLVTRGFVFILCK